MILLVFQLRPATPGWGVGVCVCLCACSAYTPPLLAGVCSVGVCAWARVLAAPRHSWMGCWGFCVFVCVLRLYPATPGWGVRFWVCVLGLRSRLRPATPGWGVGLCVCLCARSACTPPLLARVCGVVVGACARVSAAPRHSWRGCWGVCVFVCALRLYPATPGWGLRCKCVCFCSGLGCAPPLLAGVLGLCVCLCVCSACTPRLLAGVCGVGECAWARVSAAPRHSWLECWGMCVFMCALRLYPATPGRGVRCGCVCLGSGSGCAPPLLSGALGCVCVCVTIRLYPGTPGWGVWCGCVCLGSGFGCAPPLLAGVLGLCVCLCVCSACTLPLPAGVCGVDVCVWARVSAAPRHSWLRCVCAFLSELGLCPAPSGWGVRCVGWLSSGTRSCAVVRYGLCELPGFAAAGGQCCLAPALVP